MRKPRRIQAHQAKPDEPAPEYFFLRKAPIIRKSFPNISDANLQSKINRLWNIRTELLKLNTSAKLAL